MFISIFIWLYIAFAKSVALGGGDILVNVQTIPSDTVIKNASEDLNLTCRVNSNASPRYQVSWILPIKKSSENENARISIFKQQTELTVTIHHLQESDSGQYTCEVMGNGIQMKSIVKVTVKSTETQAHLCSETFFPCTRTQCIPKRYLCDGYLDCFDGKDESPQFCGTDVCKGKIQCDDGRCLAPELCCDPLKNDDCRPYLVPCCQKALQITTEVDTPDSNLKAKFRDITFKQSTVYTIVSCIAAFIFVTLIIIMGFFRFHMKRSAMLLTANSQLRTSNYSNRSNYRNGPASRRFFYWPWRTLRTTRPCPETRWNETDEDQVSGETLCQSQLPHPYPCTISSTGSFIIMYSGPNGIKIMERLPKPPPYSESPPPLQMRPLPNDDLTVLGPPPLYQSVENIGTPQGEAV